MYSKFECFNCSGRFVSDVCWYIILILGLSLNIKHIKRDIVSYRYIFLQNNERRRHTDIKTKYCYNLKEERMKLVMAYPSLTIFSEERQRNNIWKGRKENIPVV